MIQVDIITPDQTVYAGDAVSVTIPTADGEITVLSGHIPLIGIVVPGTVVVRSGNDEQLFAVSRGVLELDGKSIKILADTADRAEALEESMVEKAKADAEKLMTEKRTDVEAFAEATAMLERELARLKTVRRHRSAPKSMPRSVLGE